MGPGGDCGGVSSVVRMGGRTYLFLREGLQVASCKVDDGRAARAPGPELIRIARGMANGRISFSPGVPWEVDRGGPDLRSEI